MRVVRCVASLKKHLFYSSPVSLRPLKTTRFNFKHRKKLIKIPVIYRLTDVGVKIFQITGK